MDAELVDGLLVIGSVSDDLILLVVGGLATAMVAATVLFMVYVAIAPSFLPEWQMDFDVQTVDEEPETPDAPESDGETEPDEGSTST